MVLLKPPAPAGQWEQEHGASGRLPVEKLRQSKSSDVSWIWWTCNGVSDTNIIISARSGSQAPVVSLAL